MSRLDTDRQKELEPKRMEFARQQLEKLGYKIISQTETEITFDYDNKRVHYFPYSGWHSGSSIVDGRGWTKLLKQIKNK